MVGIRIWEKVLLEHLTWSWVYFSTAAGILGTGVGSRWLECLTPNPHASLFSAKAAHFHVSLITLRPGLFRSPSSSGTRIVILVMEFMREEERATCPYHLKCLVRRAAVTSCTPNIAQSVSADTSSLSLTPQIQRTIDLSFWRSHCKSGAVGAQVSLPCNRQNVHRRWRLFRRSLETHAWMSE